MTKKIAIGLSCAFALVFSFGGAVAHAQLRSLPGSYTSPVRASGQTITRPLTIGSVGADVQALQAFLATRGYFTTTPTGYYGPITAAAVSSFQAANGISPNGYFGPQTLAVYNALISGGGTGTPTAGCPSGARFNIYTGKPCTGGSPDSSICREGYTLTTRNGTPICIQDTNNDDDNPLRGDDDYLEGDEASLDNYDISEGDDVDNLEEGDNEAELVQAEFDVEDGDIELDEVTFLFTFIGNTSNASTTPWDVFESLTLLGDGDEIADINTDHKNDWDKEGDNTYSITFDDLDQYIVRQDDTAELTLEAEIANDVAGGENGDAKWKIAVEDDGIVATDASGDEQEIGDEDETITVAIGEESNNGNNTDDAELSVSDSNDTPDEDEIIVKENSTSSWKEIFVFEMEANESDIVLNELPVSIEFLDGGEYDDYISDVQLEIDGEEYDEGDADIDMNGDTAVITFDLDGDVTINEDDTVEVTLSVRFAALDGNYDEGSEIRAFIDSDNVEDIDAETDSGDELSHDQLDGEAEGETQTLVLN